MGNTWAVAGVVGVVGMHPGGSRLWTIRLLHPYSNPASTVGVHGPAAAHRSGRALGRGGTYAPPSPPTPTPTPTWGPSPEGKSRHGYNTPQPSHHHLYYENAHPPSPPSRVTLPPFSSSLFAVVGVHANSLVLGPPDSVTLLTLFLIYYSFPPLPPPRPPLPPGPSSTTTRLCCCCFPS